LGWWVEIKLKSSEDVMKHLFKLLKKISLS